jgi:hypothetical protein
VYIQNITFAAILPSKFHFVKIKLEPFTPNITQTNQKLLLASFVCSPLFALREFLRFSGVDAPHYFLYFNLLKDFLLVIVTGLCVAYLIIHRQYPRTITPYFLLFTGATLLVAGLSIADPLMVLGGIRWALPILLIFLLCGHIDKPLLGRLAYVAAFLLLVTTIIQVYQAATQQFRWGQSMYGSLLGRVSGFYELPSIAGFNTCLYFFIIRYYYTGRAWVRKMWMLLGIGSTFFLSISTTGFILMLIMLVFPLLYRPGRYRPVYMVLAVILSIITYMWIDQLNGRYPGDSSMSWNIRVGLMQEQWQKAQLISNRFGSATNSAFVIKGAFGQAVSPIYVGGGESIYPPLLGNYGIVFFICFIGTLLVAFVKLTHQRYEPAMLFFLVAVLGGLTVRATETFPLGILLSVLGAYYINPNLFTPQSTYKEV